MRGNRLLSLVHEVLPAEGLPSMESRITHVFGSELRGLLHLVEVLVDRVDARTLAQNGPISVIPEKEQITKTASSRSAPPPASPPCVRA